MPLPLVCRVHADGVHLVLERRFATQPGDAGVTDQLSLRCAHRRNGCGRLPIRGETPPPARGRRRRTAAPPARRIAARRRVSMRRWRRARGRSSLAPLRGLGVGPAQIQRDQRQRGRRPVGYRGYQAGRCRVYRFAARQGEQRRVLGGPGHGLRRSGVDVGGRIDRRAVGTDSVAITRPIDFAPTGIGDDQRSRRWFARRWRPGCTPRAPGCPAHARRPPRSPCRPADR